MKKLEIDDVIKKKEQRGILAICALNRLDKEWEIRRSINIGRLKCTFEMRSKNRLMGRFGGGWNWHIGVEWSKHNAIFFVLVFMLRFNLATKEQ